MSSKDELFRQLYQDYYSDVVHLLKRRGAEHETALELAQDIFARVYKGLDDYRGEGHRTWIWTIAKRTWFNYLRGKTTIRRGAEVTTRDDTPETQQANPAPWTPTIPAPDEKALMNEQVQLLNHAVAQLPPRLRRCFLLRFRDNLSYREIADLMKISLETVKDQVRNARSRIKKALGDIDLEDADDE